MRAFGCPVCNGFVAFESGRCPNCHTALGFHLATKAMVPVADNVAHIDGKPWVRCTQSEPTGCNWLVPDPQGTRRR